MEDLNKINFNKKIGFIFGSEASGLTNNEVSYADYTLQIPSNKNFRSLNLSHSLIIVAQIVSSLISKRKIKFNKSKKIKRASKHEIMNMLDFCIGSLRKKNFFKQPIKKAYNVGKFKKYFL